MTRNSNAEENNENHPEKNAFANLGDSGFMWSFLPIGMVFMILGLTQDNTPYLSVGIVFFILSFALSAQSGSDDSTTPTTEGSAETDPDDLPSADPESK